MSCINEVQCEQLENEVEDLILEERESIDRAFEIIVDYVEKNRRESAEQIFKDYHKILKQMFCMSSKELQKFMENKILVGWFSPLRKPVVHVRFL